MKFLLLVALLGVGFGGQSGRPEEFLLLLPGTTKLAPPTVVIRYFAPDDMAICAATQGTDIVACQSAKAIRLWLKNQQGRK